MIKKSLIWDKGMGYLPILTFQETNNRYFGIERTEHGTRYIMPNVGREEYAISREAWLQIGKAYYE
jgi:hypothetical protein